MHTAAYLTLGFGIPFFMWTPELEDGGEMIPTKRRAAHFDVIRHKPKMQDSRHAKITKGLQRQQRDKNGISKIGMATLPHYFWSDGLEHERAVWRASLERFVGVLAAF